MRVAGYWLLLGLFLASINIVLLYQFWLGGISLIWTLLLIYCHFPKRWWLTVGCGVLLSGYYGMHVYQMRTWQQHLNESLETKVLIHGDDLHYQGVMVTGNGLLPSGEPVRISWRVKQPQTFKKLQRTKTMMCWYVRGIKRAIAPNRNAYNFNPAGYWRSRGIQHTLLIEEASYQDRPLPKHLGQAIYWQFKNWHAQAVMWFEKLPSGIRDYGETLLLGYTRPNFYQENSGIQTLGIVHLFSISGFQVAGIYMIWRRIGRWLRITKEHSLIIVQFLMLGILLFAGGVQSLIRAVLLGIGQAWRELGWLKVSAVDAWGLSLCGGLLIEPGVLHNLGGQLSYLLTFGLLWLDKRPGWWQSLFLSILILPVLLWHTFAWQPVSLIANLVAVPLFTWFVIPVVFLGVLAALLQQAWLLAISQFIITKLQMIIQQGDKLPGELLFGQPPLVLCAGLMVCLLGWLAAKKKRRWLIALIVGYGVAFGWHRLPIGGFLTVIDVGQGDTTVVHFATGQTLLVDVGGRHEVSSPEWGQPVDEQTTNLQTQQIQQFLRAQAINQIDEMVLTHKDIDHIGNFRYLTKQMRVKHVNVPLGMTRTRAFKQMIKPYYPRNKITEIQAGQQLLSDVFICHPFTAGTGENEDSVALLIKVGPEKALLTGDLDKTGEERLLQRTTIQQVAILKFGHHGSQTSTSTALLQRLKPKWGIVSAGVNNRYHHPSEETLQLARHRGMIVYGTLWQGMITYRWLGQHGAWHTQLPGPKENYSTFDNAVLD